ncbi:MAG: glycosyltransferase, partial [Magnetovibrio sp.]|nr:glycosyltransferase [Magnetovibrio sp.]
MLTIIIPTLNAENILKKTLNRVQAYAWEDVEVLVVDGGSQDQTLHVARGFQATVITSPAGRGQQLALGAQTARGPWMLFLHADTQLPPDWDLHIGKFMSAHRSTERAAYFRLAFDDDSSGSNRVTILANWRAQNLGLPYGDQGL